MVIHRRRHIHAHTQSDKFISERTIIYCVSGMWMIVRYDSHVCAYRLHSTACYIWYWYVVEHESIIVSVCVHHHFCFCFCCGWLIYFVYSFFRFGFIFFVPFCPLAFKSPHLRIQCERSSQLCISVCVSVCLCGDFFMVSLIRIFKVYTYICERWCNCSYASLSKTFNAFFSLERSNKYMFKVWDHSTISIQC